MNHYTTEYKDALHHTSKLYFEGVISSNTLNVLAENIASTFTRIMEMSNLIGSLTQQEVLDDLDTLSDLWDKYEVLR